MATKTAHSTATREGLGEIAQETLDQTKFIIEEHVNEGATEDSIFYAEQLPSLPPLNISGNKTKYPVDVINGDSYTAAREMMDQHPGAKGSVAVLNLASDEEPGGGWLRYLTKTQEEALCYSSTLYITLRPSYYPWPNLGPGSAAGIFSPGVVIFKDDLDHECLELPKDQRRVVSVITVAGPRLPAMTDDGEGFARQSDLEDLREKIRLVYRMAAHHKQRYLVLGANGCGVYGSPPKAVASEMKSILLDPEFHGYFERVVFAVYDKNGSMEKFVAFRDTFAGVEI